MVQRIPNYITFFRLGLIPVFVVLMIEPTRPMVYAAAVVFIIAVLTDYLDGIVARRFGAVSDFGKLLDPLADKMLVTSALVMLIAQRSDLNGEPWVYGWMVVLVLLREIWVTGLRGVAASQGTIVSARGPGKVKSGLQMVSIVFLLLHDAAFNFLHYRITCQTVGLWLLFLSIFFSYWSGFEYTYEILFGPASGKPSSSPLGEKTKA